MPIKSRKTKRKSSQALSEIYSPEWLTGRYDYNIHCISNSKKSRSWAVHNSLRTSHR